MTSAIDDPRDRKRRMDVEEMHRHSLRREGDRYGSTSPPTRGGGYGGRVDDRRAGVPTGNGRGASPSGNTSLPTFSELHHSRGGGGGGEEDDGTGKRRRVEYDPRVEATGEYHHGQRGSVRGYADERYAGGPPALPPSSGGGERRSIGEEGFDANVPLARRRGDAAQAKASRLHIDTGYSPDAAQSGSRYAHASLHAHPAALSHHGVKSAPPYKVAFSDRDHGAAGHPLDLRGDPQARGYGPPGPHLHGANSYAAPPSSGYGRREVDEYDGQEHAAAVARREPMHPAVASHVAGAHAQSQSYRGGPPIGAAGTPLTATRNAFVPQTATLPSPAYHTTQFVRQAGGGGGGVGASANAGSSMLANGNGASSAVAPGTAAAPRTAGLNPPMTARLPEHLRSPPSSKTQFLSLFSNFYDSLQDSRTLKVTLEDQVRRSNTLLQTLQRSARVLELTVERRLTAERSMWESKVQALEERCRRLERATGAGSPTPPPRATEEERTIEKENGEGTEEKEATLSEAEKEDEAEGDEAETGNTRQRVSSGGKDAMQSSEEGEKERKDV